MVIGLLAAACAPKSAEVAHKEPGVAHGDAGAAPAPEMKMMEVRELHHWLAYKAAVAATDDKEVAYHLKKAMALATDPKHRSTLDGLVVEHMTEGHFVHVKNTLKELLGPKAEPSAAPTALEARLAQALVKENKVAEARDRLQHMVAIFTGPGKEVAQQALESLHKGDAESAGKLLSRLSEGQ